MWRSLVCLIGLICGLNALAETSKPELPKRKIASVSKRPQIKASDFMRALDSSGQLDALEPLIKGRIDELSPSSEARRLLMAEWEAIRRNKDYGKLDHFPVVPLNQIANLRAALGGRGALSEKVDIAVLKARLEDILGECRELAPLPKPISARMPMLTDGHFPDPGLGLCEQDRSIKFARVLNSLMAANGSEVKLGSVKARSAQRLFQVLIESGHSVEMRNERTYANFLSLNFGDQPVIWPVWLDTGLKTSDGKKIEVPVGHSHHAFVIEGPIVKASVMFYLGTSGVGFFAQIDERPAWTGTRVSYSIHSAHSANDSETILRSLDFASRYYRRIQNESQNIAQGMPLNGYGYLGVCNDSNALLEKVNKSTVTTFPLMRAAELDSKSRASDGLDEIFRSLPKDSKQFPRTEENLSRILAMTPFDSLDDRDLHDEKLREILKSLEAEVGR